MKTIDFIATRIIFSISILLWASVIPLAAQQPETGYFTVSGIVRDGHNRRPLANVSVTVPGSRVGTVSNADGTFSLKIRHDLTAGEIQFSHVGYLHRLVPVSGTDHSGLTVYLNSRAILLDDVEIHNRDPLSLVQEALRRIGANYTDHSALLTGFYRETIQKRQPYIEISEAIVEVYATGYTSESRGEAVRIVKGRRLVSPRTTDTLAVKLQGGPNTYVFGNIVKNREFVLDPQTLHFYRFEIEDVVLIDEKLHDVVRFHPQVVLPEDALYEGKLYIDRENFTISRAEFRLDMSDRNKVTGMILRRKPFSLRFYPDEVAYVVGYRERNGRSYLNYIRNTIRFRCDWRRKLFRTNYTVTAEMVITDGRDDQVFPIPFRETFRQGHSLSDRVGDFYDPGFWEDYNIIAPTESLESAVDRLRKRME